MSHPEKSYEDHIRIEGLQTPHNQRLSERLNIEESRQYIRATLKDRLISQTHHAKQEAGRAQRLERLLFLLDKHPEIAEILDLLDGLDLR